MSRIDRSAIADSYAHNMSTDDGVDDDHDAHESAVRLPDGWTTTRIRCFLCAIAPLAPQPRVCAVCAGTGYVLTEVRK